MSDTTIIPAQLGFFVLEPFSNDCDQYAGFHKYPVVAWKIIDVDSYHSALSVATPVILACELDDNDISHMAMEIPGGQVHLVIGASENFYATAQEWFNSLKPKAF